MGSGNQYPWQWPLRWQLPWWISSAIVLESFLESQFIAQVYTPRLSSACFGYLISCIEVQSRNICWFLLLHPILPLLLGVSNAFPSQWQLRAIFLVSGSSFFFKKKEKGSFTSSGHVIVFPELLGLIERLITPPHPYITKPTAAPFSDQQSKLQLSRWERNRVHRADSQIPDP